MMLSGSLCGWTRSVADNVLHLLSVLLLACVGACRGQASGYDPGGPSASTVMRGAGARADQDPGRPPASPPGAWRKLAPAELQRTLLWLSHIVIRHREVGDTQVCFNLVGWQTAQALPGVRTRAEALMFAERLADSVRRGAAFDDFARRFSEEPETAERGGSLGAVVARHLAEWPHVLDAVASLEPGAVSNVVETECGYHVFLRRAPPAELELSGSHILIAHAAAPWVKLFARGAVPDRSREQARALAQDLFARLRRQPNDFASLAAEFSDHFDASRGGDFGTWSTREIGSAREIETLAGLEIGQVAEPIDTLYGYQILRRTELRPRKRFAMAKLSLLFDADLPDSNPGSEIVAQRRMEEFTRLLKSEPEQFSALQEQVCCTPVFEVFEGRHRPELEALLASLAPGEIAAAQTRDLNTEYVIPKRLPLEALPARVPVLVELPGRVLR